MFPADAVRYPAHSIQYQGKEAIEPHMEKFRYYVELPGDIWEDGIVMDVRLADAQPLQQRSCLIKPVHVQESSPRDLTQ